MSSIRLRSVSLRAVLACAMIALTLILLTVGSSLRPAGAATNGPAIDMTSDTAVVAELGEAFNLLVATQAPQGTPDPYKGYVFEVTYDPTRVAIDSNGPADRSKQSGLWSENTCHSTWDDDAPGEPGRKLARLNCQATTDTQDVGLLGSVKFTAIAPGAAIFIFQPNPDRTFTTTPGDAAQSNDLTCDGEAASPCVVVVDILPPDLSVTIAADDLNPSDEADVAFSVTVDNHSTTTAATQVAATVEFPAGLVPHETASQPAGCVTDGQVVTCTGPDPLDAEATWVVSDATTPILATADWSDTSLPPEVVVTATVSLFEADPDLANNVDEVAIANGGAVDVAITQLTRNMYGPDLVRGAPLWYVATVSNPSPTLSVTTSVSMTLPDELIPWVTSSSTCTIDGQTITCAGVAINPGSSVNVFLRGAVDFYDPPASVPGNVCATVTSDRPDPDLANNTACDDGSATPVAPDTSGDGYSDAHKVALGKDPNVFCAIMRGDVDRSGVINITDIVIVSSAAGDPAVPGRFDQFEVQLADGSFRPDNVLDQRDVDLVGVFFGRSVNDCE